MEYDEWDQSGHEEGDGQYRRAYRAPLSGGALSLGSSKKKPKRPVRIRVEKFIFFMCGHYEVDINRNGLLVKKLGFKGLVSAREYRDEKLAGFVKPTRQKSKSGSRSHVPAIFLK